MASHERQAFVLDVIALLVVAALGVIAARAAVVPGQSPAASAILSGGDSVISPPYTPAPDLTVRPGVPKGAIHEFTMKSADSRIYPGIEKTQPGIVVPYERRVGVYVPAQYVPGTAAPFIVVQDGRARNTWARFPRFSTT